MEPRKNNSEGKHEHPLRHEISREEKIQAGNAHNEADKDMEDDVELTGSSPNDDLDEGETARLGEDKTGLV